MKKQQAQALEVEKKVVAVVPVVEPVQPEKLEPVRVAVKAQPEAQQQGHQTPGAREAKTREKAGEGVRFRLQIKN